MHEGDVDKRTQYIIEALFLVRKGGFEASGFPAVPSDLDLVDTEDQITHEVGAQPPPRGGSSSGPPPPASRPEQRAAPGPVCSASTRGCPTAGRTPAGLG